MAIEYTDPHTVLGVHRGASREEVKAAFRRAALACHPDVDHSPEAAARFARIKTAADVLLKGHQQQAASGGAWHPAAAAAAAGRTRATAVPRNRTAALWAGALVACGLAFGYGYGWASYVRRRSTSTGAADGEERIRSPSPQRRKLLQTLLADQQQQALKQQERQGLQQERQQQQAEARAEASSCGGSPSG